MGKGGGRERDREMFISIREEKEGKMEREREGKTARKETLWKKSSFISAVSNN